ncbi:hypothetical protein [Zhihengliuella salsuginis]|uniref:Uncharacterized protein n=1 Tax=Zhihengliuella salsuginis TaxID=578222 RepID=A0ABQ3GFH7_9MICC|nr:hypothetical protein [Zhihengliuella salsuginis]GHD03576.1 hypothetical protein GCM10008096_09740 [Zhihengliuella salsuginis]
MPLEFAGSAAGAWIAGARSSTAQPEDHPTAASQLPGAFEAYARLFHPAVDFDGRPVRWSAIAASRSARLHPAAQFANLAAVDESGFALAEDAWEGDPPRADGLPMTDLAALVDVIAGHTGAAPVYLALWTGYAFAAGENDGAKVALSASEREDVLTLGDGGYQDYWVFSGTLEDLREPVWAESERSRERRAPDLAWPEDRSWFVSTELYEDSTLIGGSAELIATVVSAATGHDAGFEALAVEPSTRLDEFGDTVNVLPEPPIALEGGELDG